jgi:CHAT domain-containing protein
MRRDRLVLAAALTASALTLLACEQLKTGAPAGAPSGGPSGEGVALGTSLVGEPCRSEPRKGVLGEPGAPAPIDIFCGKGTRPAAGLVATFLPLALPDDVVQRRTTIERTAAASATGRETASRLACEAGRWSEGPGGEFFISPCTLRSGNWPQVTVVASSGKLLFQGEGLTAALPVLETAIARMSGVAPAEGAEAADRNPTAQIRKFEQSMGGQLVLFGSDDFDRYSELTQLARLYNSAGNFAGSEAAYRRALEIQTRVLGANSSGVGDTLMHLALAVSNQGRFDESANLFERASPIVEASTDVSDRALFYTYQGYDKANQGKFGDGLKLVRQATSLRRNQLPPGGVLADEIGAITPVSAIKGEIAHSLITEAAVCIRVDDVGAAEAAVVEALTILAETPNLPPWWRADALTVMGDVNASRGRMPFAERNFRDAATIRQRLFGDTASTALTYLHLGRVYGREQLHAQAVAAFRTGLKMLEKDEVARAGLIFDQIGPFIPSAIELGKKDPAQRAQLDADIFKALQLSGTNVSDQTIARATARLATDNPQLAELVRALQEAERKRDSARIELANETAKPDDRRGAVKEDALSKEFRTASVEVDELNKKLGQVYPSYATMAKPTDVDLPTMQKLLRPGEALLVFQFTRDAGYAVLVRKDRLAAAPLPIKRDELREAVADLRQAFTPRGSGVEDFNLAASYALYRKLFEPLKGELDGITHLIAVPSGPLASLPLGVLVTEPTRGRDYSNAAFLVRKVAVSQVPSVRAFAALRGEAHRSTAPLPFFGVANPTFEGRAAGGRNQATSLDVLAGQCRDGGPMPSDLLRALAPLPETEAEVATVARLVGAGPGATLYGANATETALREKKLDQYRILYFATHGLLPGELRCQSEPGLALSPPRGNAASKDADGLLDASEIAGFRLDADLVVLSACNTAQGAGKFGGEALSGLAEAFFHAGARSLLASHWPVPSTQTVRLMTGVFQQLGPDLAKGAAPALRQSQLAMLAQPATAHPYFWAAFTLIGDGAGAAALVADRTAQ